MIRKFQQGGQADQQQAVMQFIQGIAQVAQVDPQLVIQLAQQEPERLEAAVQVFQQTQDIQQAAQAFFQKEVQSARRGAKLNYLKRLTGRCPEGTELVYFKAGGRVCSQCMAKKKDSIKKEKCGSKMKKGCGGLKTSKKFLTGGYILKYLTPAGPIVERPDNTYVASRDYIASKDPQEQLKEGILDYVPFIAPIRDARRGDIALMNGEDPTNYYGAAAMGGLTDLLTGGWVSQIAKKPLKAAIIKQGLRRKGYTPITKGYGPQTYIKVNPATRTIETKVAPSPFTMGGADYLFPGLHNISGRGLEKSIRNGNITK